MHTDLAQCKLLSLGQKVDPLALSLQVRLCQIKLLRLQLAQLLSPECVCGSGGTLRPTWQSC